MIRLTLVLRRRPDMSPEEFARYWLTEHGPLVQSFAGVLGMRRYVQSHTLRGRLGEMLTNQRGTAEAFDGVADVWFDDLDSLLAAASSPDGSAALNSLLADERRFIDLSASSIMLVEEHEMIPSREWVSAGPTSDQAGRLEPQGAGDGEVPDRSATTSARRDRVEARTVGDHGEKTLRSRD